MRAMSRRSSQMYPPLQELKIGTAIVAQRHDLAVDNETSEGQRAQSQRDSRILAGYLRAAPRKEPDIVAVAYSQRTYARS